MIYRKFSHLAVIGILSINCNISFANTYKVSLDGYLCNMPEGYLSSESNNKVFINLDAEGAPSFRSGKKESDLYKQFLETSIDTQTLESIKGFEIYSIAYHVNDNVTENIFLAAGAEDYLISIGESSPMPLSRVIDSCIKAATLFSDSDE